MSEADQTNSRKGNWLSTLSEIYLIYTLFILSINLSHVRRRFRIEAKYVTVRWGKYSEIQLHVRTVFSHCKYRVARLFGWFEDNKKKNTNL